LKLCEIQGKRCEKECLEILRGGRKLGKKGKKKAALIAAAAAEELASSLENNKVLVKLGDGSFEYHTREVWKNAGKAKKNAEKAAKKAEKLKNQGNHEINTDTDTEPTPTTTTSIGISGVVKEQSISLSCTDVGEPTNDAPCTTCGAPIMKYNVTEDIPKPKQWNTMKYAKLCSNILV
jgi:hypothetical protein